MIPKELNSQKLPQYDMTSICDFLHCPRYFYWRHERQYNSTEIKLPLVYGIAIHAMLATWYKTHSVQDALKSFDGSWSKHGSPDGDEKRNPVRAAEIMLGYKNYYPTEPFKVVDTEVVGALPAGNIMVIVIIDLVADYPGYGYLPLDHKTASYLNDAWWAGMYIKHQYSAYLWAMRQLFGKNCNSLFVNGILVDRKRVMFERQPTSRSDWELNEWLEDVNQVHASVELCRKNNVWAKNDDYCTRWGGRPDNICQYHQLCTTTGVNYRELTPGSNYKIEVWNPLTEER